MEIGRYQHGLCVWITKGKEGQLCSICGCGPFKKYTLFLLINMMDFMDKLAKLYVNKVIRWHGVPISIVLD
jgi:hypothetical protein